MTPWVTRLIIANVAVFILQYLRPPITDAFAFVPALVLVRPWAILTYMFLHGGISHILFNMLGLFFFGPRMEAEIGSKHFIGLYVASGIVGALLSILTPYSAIIGASGAVYGVMLAYAMYWPRDQILVWGIIPVEVRIMVVLMTILSLFGGFGGGGDGIAHFTHLGGFLGGFLYIKWMRRNPRLDVLQKKVAQTLFSTSDIERWKTIRRESLHEVNREEFDRIMAKLGAAGVQGLTATERAFLDRFSTN